ncbi:MAG: transposase [Phycisphaeraceae bacterium]|nr:transposase [Phycisphaeraceae bacterium]
MARELHYTIEQRGLRTQAFTLVTTLVDEQKYAKQELAELYSARGQIETNLKHLKQTMGMDVLRSKTVEGVQKELWVYLIVYNQVRLFMLGAAERQGVAPDRISFIDALDALDALRRRNLIVAVTVALIVNPLRPGRDEPRVIKRRKDRYRYMTKPREALRKALGITKTPT